MPNNPGFHARDGWHFRRQLDGAVTITGGGQVTLDPDTWASIAAAVSARGETSDTWRMARAFHAMNPASKEAAHV